MGEYSRTALKRANYECRIMDAIDECQGINFKDLCEKVELCEHSVRPILNECIKDGIIYRIRKGKGYAFYLIGDGYDEVII